MKIIVRVIDFTLNISGHLAGWLIMGIMGLTMVEVVSRYLLHHPLMLADEFGAYSMLAIVFLGLAYCWKEGGHIRITFLINRIPLGVRNWIRLATLSLALVYVGVAGQASYQFIAYSIDRGIKSPSHLMTPLAVPQMVIPIGFTLLFLVLVIQVMAAVRNIKTGVSDKVVKDTGEGAGE